MRVMESLTEVVASEVGFGTSEGFARRSEWVFYKTTTHEIPRLASTSDDKEE